MISFNIPEQDTKEFMAKLFKEDLFDKFEIRSLSIDTFTNFSISGKIASEEGEKKYCTWQEIRPYALAIIKGKIKPSAIKIVFSPSEEVISSIHTNAASLHLTLNFNGEKITFTTATSQKNFSLDKHLDEVWDEFILKYFKQNNIAVLND